MSEIPNNNDGILRSFLWPTIQSINDAKDSSQALGSILACYFAATNIFHGIYSSDAKSILLGLVCCAAAYGIWYQKVYWLSALMGCLGVINSSTIVYIKYLIIQNGGSPGAGAFTLLLLVYSVNTIRVYCLLTTYDRRNLVVGKQSTSPAPYQNLSSKNEFLKRSSDQESKTNENSPPKRNNNLVLWGVIVAFLALIYFAANKEKINGGTGSSALAPSAFKETELTTIAGRKYSYGWVFEIENNTEKLIKKVKIFWMPNKCGAKTVEEIRAIQNSLKQKGFDPGPIDGSWGRKTMTAMQRFQKSQGLQITKSINLQSSIFLDVYVYSFATKHWLDGGDGYIVENENKIKPFSKSFVSFEALLENQKKMSFDGEFCHIITGYY